MSKDVHKLPLQSCLLHYGSTTLSRQPEMLQTESFYSPVKDCKHLKLKQGEKGDPVHQQVYLFSSSQSRLYV